MLEIQKFISDNHNWREILTNEPYSLIINQTDDRIIFRYVQGISDYSYPLVREARGLILDKNDYHVISMGFTKFFLCDSEFADDIDWNNIRVEDKADGTLIVLYYYKNEWIPATNGTMDAHSAPLCGGDIITYGQLFDIAANKCGLDYSKLNTDYCYMFELTSPYNIIVVPYDEISITHIGTRDRITLRELDTDIGIKKPKIYSINNLDDAIKAVNDINFHGEGFVVVDKDYHRIKVKSDEWFKWHYMIGNSTPTTMTLERALDILLSDDADEFIAKYPHYKSYMDKVKSAYIEYGRCINHVIITAKNATNSLDSRKDFAEYYGRWINAFESEIDKDIYSGMKNAYFSVWDNPNYSYKDYLNSVTSKHKLRDFTKIYANYFA